MIITLPDGSDISLLHIVAITPVFVPHVQSNDLAKIDTSPRFVVFAEGNAQFTIRAESTLPADQQAKKLEDARSEILEQWRMVYEGPKGVNIN